MAGKQCGISDYEQTNAKNRSKKEKFLADMDQIVRWQPLLDLIEPVFQKSSSSSARKDDASPFEPAGGLMEQINASIQPGCLG
jgi:hypothetical protein